MRESVTIWLALLWLGFQFPSQAATRVALLDFSTDDNSYRSIEAAAQFTSLVQIGLADERDIEWVERSQLRLAKAEFALAEMPAAGGASPLRRGRVLGANWSVTGHFSSDDRERPTVAFQVIELDHADVLARDTVVLPEVASGATRFGTNQVASAVAALRRLLADARAKQLQAANQARLAFLFFADASEFGFGRGPQTFGRELVQTLERVATTNQQLRLVRFPKAYQSTEESELAVDGIIASGEDSWRQTADRYVWGSYRTTNSYTAGRRETKLEVELSLWDGVSRPLAVKESLSADARGEISASQQSDLINRLVGRITSTIRRTRAEPDSPALRQEVAASIVQSYLRMTGRGASSLGLHDREKFVAAVHMLETACFFDPNNAEARLLWLTCRYGWWIDFRHDVKNEFWTQWRRNLAWKEYVERFGLQPARVPLPFPFDRGNAAALSFVGSLEDVIKLFPQWDTIEEANSEDQSQQQGVHTSLMSAQYHGFPKQMPNDLAFQWRKELEAELSLREKQVADFSKTNATMVEASAPLSAGTPTAAGSKQVPAPAQQSAPPPAPLAGMPGGRTPMVATPSWLKDWLSLTKLFRLYPPNVLPVDPKPERQVIQFPPSYEVKVIRQMVFRGDEVWILAMDERSAPSSAAKPELAAERKDESGRLWRLPKDATRPTLFSAENLPANINTMLFRGDQLWLGGDSVVALNLADQAAKKFGIAEGLGLGEVEALAAAGTRVFAAGDTFKVSAFDPTSSRWEELTLPVGNYSGGTGNPYLLAGNDRWLGYVAGVTRFHNLATGSWTNATQFDSVRCLANDGANFWIGGRRGLQCFETGRQTVQQWNAPVFIESSMIGLVGNNLFTGNAQMASNQLAEADKQIRDRLRRLEGVRHLAHLARTNLTAPPDPFQLSARIPGDVAALANDGEYLWLGVDNYFGSYLLLLHKSSGSLVAGHTMGVRERISSVAVSGQFVWAGTAYGDNALLRFPRSAFLSVPRSQWVSLVVTPEERQRIVRGLSKTDQALYAFYAGDDAQVLELLRGLDPEKAGLQEMMLLTWSNDASGVDDPDQFRAWAERVQTRYPDTPWARHVAELAKPNEAAHEARRARALALAKFDRNHDGQLDAAETRAMSQDPEFAKVQAGADEKQLRLNLEQVVARYDRNADARLDSTETTVLCAAVTMYQRAQTELPGVRPRKPLLTPLLDVEWPAAPELFRRFDANHDAGLDAAELQTLLGSLRKVRR